MRQNITMPIICALLLAVSSSVIARASEMPPHHFQVAGMFMRIHQGTNLNVQAGTTNLDERKWMDCKSVAGCTINIESVMLAEGDYQYTVCSLVDGKPAPPACPPQYDLNFSTLQSVYVKQGRHSVQTQITVGGAGIVKNWQINYTLYEQTYR